MTLGWDWTEMGTKRPRLEIDRKYLRRMIMSSFKEDEKKFKLWELDIRRRIPVWFNRTYHNLFIEGYEYFKHVGEEPLRSLPVAVTAKVIRDGKNVQKDMVCVFEKMSIYWANYQLRVVYLRGAKEEEDVVEVVG